MNAPDLTQLGVSGIIVTFMGIVIVVIWGKYQESIKQNRADIEQVIPALLAATQAMTEVAQVANRMADRERGR